MTDLTAGISHAIALTKRLKEISKNIEEAEFKNALADLLSDLADMKVEAAELRTRLADLEEENAQLKHVQPSPDEQPIGKQFGCYRFEDDENLYCPGCWDSKRKKHSTSRAISTYRICNVCQTPIGA